MQWISIIKCSEQTVLEEGYSNVARISRKKTDRQEFSVFVNPIHLQMAYVI
jgi:hypothetical protein